MGLVSLQAIAQTYTRSSKIRVRICLLLAYKYHSLPQLTELINNQSTKNY